MTLFWFVLGLVVLVAGAELLVRGASKLALAFGVSPLVVGLTVEYYSAQYELVNSCILHTKSVEELITIIREYSGKKRFLKAQKQKADSESIISKILNESESKLHKYLTGIDSHLNNLSLADKCDSTLTNIT